MDVNSNFLSSFEWGTMIYSFLIFLVVVAVLIFMIVLIVKRLSNKTRSKEQDHQISELHQELKNIQTKLQDLTDKIESKR